MNDDLSQCQSSIQDYQSRKKSEEKAKLKERRESIAKSILTGMYANLYFKEHSLKDLAIHAIVQANELIKQLDKEHS